MTQAFNLSQFANKVNSAGQANLTTAVTGSLPTANGGTNGDINGTGWGNQVLLGGAAVGVVAAGTAGTYLKCNGTGAPTWQAPPVTGMNYERWTANGNWTVPDGVTKALVLCIAGGGGANEGRGGKGGRVMAHLSGLTAGAVVAVTVGTGGNGDWGGTPRINTAGGSSSFGSWVTCTGGAMSAGSIGANGTYTLTSTGGVTVRNFRMLSPFFWGTAFLYGGATTQTMTPSATTIANMQPYGYSSSAFSQSTGAQTWNEELNVDPGWNQIYLANTDPKIQNAGIGGFVAIMF
jgi:hypothetical protein